MKTITLITTTLIISGSILSVAKAAPPSDIPTAVVKFGDLDTSHQTGREELYRRLSRAVRTVCSPLKAAPGSLAVGISRYEACIERAVSGAVAQINRPDFSDYVATQTRKPAGVEVRLATR